MGQFEYTVGLSPVRPEDIDQLAKDYLAQKRDGTNMIKYEYGMLVLDNSHTKQDQQAIDTFVDAQIRAERDRIHDELMAADKHAIVQIAKFRITQIVYNNKDVVF